MKSRKADAQVGQVRTASRRPGRRSRSAGRVRPAQVLLVPVDPRTRRLQLQHRRLVPAAAMAGVAAAARWRRGGCPCRILSRRRSSVAAPLPQLGPGASRGPWGLGPQGLPLVKPPYGRITAYNMNSGDITWQVANGETYDWIKNHPALKGVNDSEDRPGR